MTETEGKYIALYRKWRPQTFEEVKGQEHITTTLQNQLKAGRIGHAYLFCGTRGTGKTSVAKIFARAVNCAHPGENGSPCNECENCRSISHGSSMDVVEIDAASNNGVDSIRQIRDEVQYSPTEGKYKVYIIDEVHMLSSGAWNALLKTLEEPPSYVIFILATTEVHKIPITILSRCQRYDFKRITNTTIYEQLKKLTQSEGVEAEDAALRYVAKAADGSMRDSLSLLEQCISFYFGQKLTYDNVLDVLGAVDASVFSQLLRGILEADVNRVVETVDSITERGRDLNQFVTDFIWYLRNLMLVQTASEDVEEMLEMSSDNVAILREEAMNFDVETLMRFIRILSELSNRLKFASAKRVLLETSLIKMMMPAMEEDISGVLQRLTNLENAVANGTVLSTSEAPAAASSPNMEKIGLRDEVPKEVITVPQAVYEDFDLIKNNWAKIRADQSAYVRSNLMYGQFSFDKVKGFVIEFRNQFFARMVDTPDHLKEIQNSIAKICGRQMTLHVIVSTQEKETKLVVGENGFINGINMEVEEEPSND